MRVATFEQLLTPPGQALVAEAVSAGGSETGLALGTRLRQRHGPDLVAAAITQARLRSTARVKLGADADRMYFTRDALEQATRSTVAAHRARRLADSGATAVV